MSALYTFRKNEYVRVLRADEMQRTYEFGLLEGIERERMMELVRSRARCYGGTIARIERLHDNYPRDNRVWLDGHCNHLCFLDWMLTPSAYTPDERMEAY